MCGDGLRVLDRSAILKVRGDAGRSKGMIADGGGESDCPASALHHAKDVIAGQRSSRKIALAVDSAE